MKSYEDYIFRYNGQQYYIILTIVFFLVLFMKEEFFSGYESIILPHVKKEKKYFGALFLTVYIYNLIPFMVISLAVFVVNGLKSAYYPVGLFCVNLMLVGMEMAAALLLGIGFFVLMKKSLLVFLSYFLVIEILTSTGNVFCSLPLTFAIVQNQGYYFTFAAPLFIGRFLILVFAYLIYKICVSAFVRRSFKCSIF